MNASDKNTDARLHELLERHLDDVLTVDEAAELNQLLTASEEARDEFWRVARVHARLRQWGEQQVGQAQQAGSEARLVAGFWSQRRVQSLFAMAAALLFFACVLWWMRPGEQPAGVPGDVRTVAAFGPLEHARWVGAEQPREGDEIRAGQQLEIAAGKVRVDFGGGAQVTLLGPAMLQVESESSAYLTLGHLNSKASTPAARGFTVRTRTARVVNLGAEFSAEAGVDGQSRVETQSGAVEVTASEQRHMLRTGEILLVEPGAAQVVVRIERGDETPAFRFSTIEPPSNADYADLRQGRASIGIAKGMLTPPTKAHPDSGSGPPAVLLDGYGQTKQDVPLESVFFAGATDDGMLLMDLGSVVPVAKINTYSWHQNQARFDNRLRAQQQYTVYGFAGETPPSVDGPLEAAGWKPIARVNSDEFFGVVTRTDRPAQQACSITSATGELGRYRYLLWDVKSSRAPDFRILNHTFYGEFDVYTRP